MRARSLRRDSVSTGHASRWITDASNLRHDTHRHGKQLLERIVAMLIKLCQALQDN
jgi:hypothetical protein